jgi:CO/xanthine dehydrogenase Mo-binding subunit
MIPKPTAALSSVVEARLTRRHFVKAGGALFVSLSLRRASAAGADKPTPVEAPIASWIEVRGDNTILVRTGRTEIGTGMSGFYTQVVAEELNVAPEAITLITGDTDKTSDGGYSAGFLGGATNLRKASAYTYQALLGLAAKRLRVPVTALRVEKGIVSAGAIHISYGDLLRGQQLDLKIPVTGKPARWAAQGVASIAGVEWATMDGLVVAGDPPLKPISQYKVVGTSFPMPVIPDKVTGKTQWSCDVVLPGMLHARMVRPTTLGSTLISAGEVDRKQYPTAEVVKKGNLVAVVSPSEWEAISAVHAVATQTKWTTWTGLPGSDNLTKTLREHTWGQPAESRGNVAEVTSALSNASHTLSASYEQAYVKHAPIGPFVAVADVRNDKTATVWTHSAHAQACRARIAHMLGTTVDNVVVRCLEHAGQFGRTTFGGDGAEADAVVLSQITGKPVRVQWTLQEDLAWSSATPAWIADIKAATDRGRVTAMHSAFYSPHMMDPRPLGAILAGMPAGEAPPGGFIATEWAYDKIACRIEQVYARENIGSESPSGGVRGLIMRTPGQRQQNFVIEAFMNEAAAAAKADPVQFRLDHTADARVIAVLQATAKAAEWETRPSPCASASKSGTQPVKGRGVCIMIRSGAYWAGIAEIAVTPSTGVVRVTKFTIGVECGKVINPRQLDRCMKGGVVMGLGEALKEEMTFDSGKVTSTDWNRYKILTMQEMPEIKVVQISRDDKGFGGGGEAPNALVPAAVAAAFFDATGVAARRLPLTPAYVAPLLKA